MDKEKETAKKLYLLQLREGGITESSYGLLDAGEKAALEKSGERFYLKPEFRRLIRVVMTGGVFDIIHLGHVYTLSEARKRGDVLVVSIAGDELVLRRKKSMIHPQEVRVHIVEHLKPVDYVLAGGSDPKRTLELVKPDVIVYGYDQEPFLRSEGVEIVKLERFIAPEKYKTRRIIEQLGL